MSEVCEQGGGLGRPSHLQTHLPNRLGRERETEPGQWGGLGRLPLAFPLLAWDPHQESLGRSAGADAQVRAHPKGAQFLAPARQAVFLLSAPCAPWALAGVPPSRLLTQHHHLREVVPVALGEMGVEGGRSATVVISFH